MGGIQIPKQAFRVIIVVIWKISLEQEILLNIEQTKSSKMIKNGSRGRPRSRFFWFGMVFGGAHFCCFSERPKVDPQPRKIQTFGDFVARTGGDRMMEKGGLENEPRSCLPYIKIDSYICIYPPNPPRVDVRAKNVKTDQDEDKEHINKLVLESGVDFIIEFGCQTHGTVS